jgi:hypothetical protein
MIIKFFLNFPERSVESKGQGSFRRDFMPAEQRFSSSLRFQHQKSLSTKNWQKERCESNTDLHLTAASCKTPGKKTKKKKDLVQPP